MIAATRGQSHTSESANHSASCIIAHASYAPANWLEHIRVSLKTLSLCCNTQAKNHVGTIPVPPRKITFAEMRDMGVGGVLIYAPTIVAATRSRSAPMAGLMMSGCPILSPALRVEPAASAVPTCGRISIGPSSPSR